MSTRQRIALLATAAAVSVAALSPAGADAATWTPAQTQKAIATADAHWPQSPCKGRELITWTTSSTDQDFAATAYADSCTLTIDTTEVARNDPSPGYLCSVLEHEFGHLAGLGHSTNSDDVMYPIVWHVVPDCAAAFPAPVKAAKATKKTPARPTTASRSHRARSHR